MSDPKCIEVPAKTYMGVICKRGHDGERYIGNRGCIACHREKGPAYAKARRAANPEKCREINRRHMRKRRAGATPVEARNISRAMRKLPPATRPEPLKCECCAQPFGHTKMTTAHLDHCHISGLFRGWLCGGCNTSIGKFGDSIKGLMNAVRYLERAVSTTIN